MPSINEVIERVGRVRPDAYDDKTKAGWLIELDGKPAAGGHPAAPADAAETGNRARAAGRVPGVRRARHRMAARMKRRDCSACPACRWSQHARSWCGPYPEDGDKPLLVGPPYDNLYDLYLMAQIDFYNREAENYNNSALAFNQAMDEYKKGVPQDRTCPSPAGTWTGLF